MGVQIFKESEVRDAILKKVPHVVTSGKRSGHTHIRIVHKGITINFLRIPNNHQKEFYGGKGNDIASKLYLSHPQYNLFVKCDLKKKEYEVILDKVIEESSKNTQS